MQYKIKINHLNNRNNYSKDKREKNNSFNNAIQSILFCPFKTAVREKPYFKFKIFSELKDFEKFKKVQISGLSIEWENGADICPDELYNNSKKILEG